MIDSIKWEPGISDNMKKKGKIVFVDVTKQLKPEAKTLDEARGLVTSDYQDKLEKEWIANLRQKYTITVNKDVLAKVK